MKFLGSLFILTTFLTLSGCASIQVEEAHKPKASIVDTTIDSSVQRIEALMLEIKGMKLPDQPISDGELITVNWTGEATMFVEALAKAKGLDFDTRGAPVLPLPITVVETKANYEDILLKVAAQITHRADLVIEDGRLVVLYRLKGLAQ